jgi:predicted XRE-type DNA-binding protein
LIARINNDTLIPMNQNYIGSDFDDFLAKEGLLAQTETIAVKRVIAIQIRELMEQQNLSKSVMAQRMHTSRAALDRLLDPENQSVTLQTLDKAAQALGKRVQIALV